MTILEPVQGGVVWGAQLCNTNNIYIESRVRDGFLKELRLWHAVPSKLPDGEPQIEIWAQYALEFMCDAGKHVLMGFTSVHRPDRAWWLLEDGCKRSTKNDHS